MKIVILPGFSIKNQQWAQEVAEKLEHDNAEVIYWDHWKSGQAQGGWIEKEAQKIINTLDNESTNIIAKSIGTAVAMVVLKQRPQSVNKLILCGIPVNDLQPGDQLYYQSLKDIPTEKLIIFQNENDNHGSLEQVKELLYPINPEILIISKPASDHEYPYFEDFRQFLK